MDKVKLHINGTEYLVEKKKTVLQVCRENHIEIPTLCYHEQLEPYGSCFLCTVEIEGGKKKFSLACGTEVFEGMKIRTDTKDVWKQRKTALELLLSNHYADCRGPCYNECPSNVDVQGYIAAIAEEDYSEAIKIIKQDNPFPAVCGRVCTRPCEDVCRRNLIDSKVGIDFLKRYASDKDIANEFSFIPEIKEKNGNKIAIVGAGPSGLSAAYYLAIDGYDIDVFEQFEKAGGMLRYGIPEYRLPNDVLDIEIKQITDIGPKIHYDQTLGKDFSLDELKEKGYKAIFIALGAHECQYMGIEGEKAKGVLGGIEFLHDVAASKNPEIGKDVIVVGGGNTAVDAARISRRLGANVTMVYRRTVKEMPAHEAEIEDALEEGIKIEFLTNPLKVVTDEENKVIGIECVKMELGEPDASGRRRPVAKQGSEFKINASAVIFAIGQKSDIKCITEKDGDVNKDLKFTAWKTVETNEKTFMTDAEGVFAGGDLRRGADTVIGGIADGKKAAWVIDKYVKNNEILPYPEEFFSKKDNLEKQIKENYKHFPKIDKSEMPKLNAEERISNFNEVELGLTDEDAKKETERCLECGCKEVFNCELKDNSTDYNIYQKHFLGEFKDLAIDERHPYITLDPNKCITCARCARICKEVMGLSVLGLVNRGYKTIVAPPMGKSLQETSCISCGLCADACPTGAITIKPNTFKPGPFNIESKETICSFCSFGCELEVKKIGNKIISVKGNKKSAVNQYGNICKLGRLGFIDQSILMREKMDIETMKINAKEIADFIKQFKPEIFVGESVSLEEIMMLKEIAKAAKTGISKVRRKSVLKTDIRYRNLYLFDVIVLAEINPFLDIPMIMPEIMKAKKKGAELIYIGKKDSDINRIADVSVDSDNIEKSLSELDVSGKIAIITTFKSIDNDTDKIIEKFAEKNFAKILFFGESANSAGVCLSDLKYNDFRDFNKSILYGNGPSGFNAKDFYYFDFENNIESGTFIRTNSPYANEGHYVNAEGKVMKRHRVITDLPYTNIEMLLEIFRLIV